MAVNFNNPTFGAYQYPMNPFPQQVTNYQMGMNGYQGMPQVNPMLQNQAQPQQQPTSASKLNGRVVNSLEEISPGEVAMDGSVSLFPFLDGSCIYAKSWNSNGSISTVKFLPENSDNSSEESSRSEDFQKSVSERLDKIEALLQSICS